MVPSPTVSFVQGSDRGSLTADEARILKQSGTLIIDERRSRTRYFDGRFLAAKDEIRDQNYFLTRLADIGRAGGAGIVAGLLIEDAGSGSVVIRAGQGITPAGETVMIPSDLTISLSDVTVTEQLDVTFGISRIPAALSRNRSGLFIIGLRPVEYTANPIASYPTSVNGPRTVQDGDIIEAAAVVLVPYIEQGQQGTPETRQSRVARKVFIEESPIGTPEDVLPLAMIALNSGNVQWIDAFMVRREIGAAQSGVLGFGFSNRPLREAYLQQYLHQLSQILKTQSGSSAKFAASQYFAALPAAGVLPSAAIDPADFSQIFFPPQIQTDISIIPDDELSVLIDESLMLPPIDLTADAGDLESTSVLILAMVPRNQLPTLTAKLNTLQSPLRPAAPGMVFQRKPIESLRGLLAVRTSPQPLVADSIQAQAWKAVIGQNPVLWYARRRNLQVRADVAASSVLVPTNELPDESHMLDNLKNAGLLDRFNALKLKASTSAVADLTKRLSSKVVADNPVLAASTISVLEKASVLDRVTVLQATEPLADPNLGKGLSQISQSNPDVADPAVMKVLGDSGAASDLDTIGQTLDKARLSDVTKQVVAIAKAGGADAPTKIADFLKTQSARTVISRLPQ